MSAFAETISRPRSPGSQNVWLLRIGRAQRMIAIAIVCQVAAMLATSVASVLREPVSVSIAILIVLPAALYAMIAAFLCLHSLKLHGFAWLAALISVWHMLLGIPMLFWMYYKASTYLEMNSVSAGFWGPSREKLREPDFPPKGSPGVVSSNCPYCGVETVASTIFVGFKGRCRQCGKTSAFLPPHEDQDGYRLHPYNEARALWNYLWQWHNKRFTEQEKQRVETGEFDEAFMQQTCDRILNSHDEEITVRRCSSCDRISRSPMTSVCHWCSHRE